MNIAYLYIFLQTCFLEFPVYYYFLRTKFSFRSSIAIVFSINALTHPIVFFFFMALKLSYLENILIAEPFAFCVEGLAIYYFLGLSPKKSILASTMANFISWQLGPILSYWIWFK